MNIVLNTEKGVEITSVNEYIEQINSLNNNKIIRVRYYFLEDKLWIIGISDQVFIETICLVLNTT